MSENENDVIAEGKMIYDASLHKTDSIEPVSPADGMRYDKSGDLSSTVKIPRMKDTTFYHFTDAGNDDVKEASIPGYVYSQIEKSANKGNLLKAVAHFRDYVEAHRDNLTPETLVEIRNYFEEAKTLAGDEQTKAFLGKLKDFSKSLVRTSKNTDKED